MRMGDLFEAFLGFSLHVQKSDFYLEDPLTAPCSWLPLAQPVTDDA